MVIRWMSIPGPVKKRKQQRKPLIEDSVIKLSSGLLRFEATAKREWFERRAINTNMMTLCNWFTDDNTRYMTCFTEIMKDLFTALEGQEVSIMRDDEVFKSIEYYCEGTRGKAARVFGTYQAIKAVGLKQFKEQHTKAIYYRLIKELKGCGFSKAQICNLNQTKPQLIAVPMIVNLGQLFEPVSANHEFADLWEQSAA